MPSWGNDLGNGVSVDVIVANNAHHGSHKDPCFFGARFPTRGS